MTPAQKAILKALAFGVVVAATVTVFLVVVGMPVWQAALLEAVLLATLNITIGWPRMPPRRRRT